ncbi:DUF2817 domain-containing protein [Pseudomaricurvus alkylphenolicus]|uniref:DUF2817 domain-containing protein n=1 Tax=Pseudomaricurvus alkylphenolicus TaxID=1306991 RepID=UPI00141E12CF|nr:DUF2817 domain-containing protein [Pseudomaricurvus alkylphenolicus]
MHFQKYPFQKYQCFPQNYAEGRQWFAEAVEQAGGELDVRINPAIKGPDDGDLSTDVGWFGPRDAKRVFVSISGTHGQEYFCGVAGQLLWIADGGPEHLPQDTAVCLIHANNPYGAAYYSRSNENNVDLNRNYLPTGRPVRPNPLYAELYDILFTPDLDEHILDDVMERYNHFMQNSDKAAAMTAMGGGQTSHPDGLIYCGTEVQWSTLNLQAIVEQYLLHAEKVVLIDWHTGLGEPGEVSVLLELDKGSKEYAQGVAWWGNAVEVDRIYDEGVMPDFVGHVHEGMARELRAKGIEVVDTVIEIGTVDNRSVIPALLIDRWLRCECEEPQSPKAITLRTMMMERLNPSTHSWRSAVLKHSQDIYSRTIAGLANW